LFQISSTFIMSCFMTCCCSTNQRFEMMINVKYYIGNNLSEYSTFGKTSSIDFCVLIVVLQKSSMWTRHLSILLIANSAYTTLINLPL
jgi:hypothetical protein